jgi:hypothetical protein
MGIRTIGKRLEGKWPNKDFDQTNAFLDYTKLSKKLQIPYYTYLITKINH